MKAIQVQDPRQFGKVAVLMGGLSAEREISLKSGKAVLQALLNKGVNAQGIDAGHDVLQQLQAGGYDRVFNILHGRGGEDGVMQGALETLGIPYTGSGVLASALSMDKIRTKQIWAANQLPTLPFAQLFETSDFAEVASRLGLPLAVKPAREGSSIGVSKVVEVSQLPEAWRKAAELDPYVIAEPWVTGGEYTAAILGDEVLPLIRVETTAVFYDYEAKYFSNTTRYHCPCGLPPQREREIAEIALEAFRALDARGWGRIDLICDAEGNTWLLENNTVPGMTDHSLVPMAARQAGIEFDELVWRILETSNPVW